jgi:predicted lipid carrier protein YhbT
VTQKADPTQAFFDELAQRGHEPLLGAVTGTLRIEVVDGDSSEHWHVDVRKGAVKVSRKNTKADAVVRVPRPLCDKIMSGQENAMAAMLRGELVPEGDLRLTMQFQRLFPGPPSSAPRRTTK